MEMKMSELLADIFSISHMMKVTDCIFNFKITIKYNRQEAKPCLYTTYTSMTGSQYSYRIKCISQNAIIYTTMMTYTIHFLGHKSLRQCSRVCGKK